MKLYEFYGIKAYGFHGDTGDTIDYTFRRLAVCADEIDAALQFAEWQKTVGCHQPGGSYHAVETVNGYRIIVGEKVSE